MSPAHCAGVLLSVVLALRPPIAHAQPPASLAATYGHPQRLVAVDGHRRLNLICLGRGQPTVIFLAGLGSSARDWRRVQPAIAKVTRACAYDRAGYGYSDAADRPADADNAVADLLALLRATDGTKPVLLVGHSLGGLYATLYAETYPRDVAGLVLVDPAFAGQTRAIAQALGPQAAQRLDAWQATQITGQQKCVELARRGLPSTPAQSKSDCLDNPLNADPELHREMNREAMTAGYEVAVASELRSANVAAPDGRTKDDLEATRVPATLGAIPLIVLTHGDGSGLPGLTKDQLRQEAAAWNAGHDRLASLSSDGRNIVVPHAGHYIQLDQPGIVIRQIEVVLARARG